MIETLVTVILQGFLSGVGFVYAVRFLGGLDVHQR